jgi:hypothetical protein
MPFVCTDAAWESYTMRAAQDEDWLKGVTDLRGVSRQEKKWLPREDSNLEHSG